MSERHFSEPEPRRPVWSFSSGEAIWFTLLCALEMTFFLILYLAR
jgi:hypothetical protein